MFYNNDLMNSSTLGEAWRAGNRQALTKPEIIGLPEVCDALNSWLESPQGHPSGRLSLRVSAIFVNGAARLYKEEVERLFQDCRELEMDMTLRKTRNLTELGPEDDRESWLAPEEILDDIGQSINPAPEARLTRKRPSSRSLEEAKRPSITSSLLETIENESTETSHFDHESYQEEVGSFNNISELNCSVLQHPNDSSSIQKSDKEVQTTNSYILKQSGRNRGPFNEDLPFGLVLIHDSYNDRLPSRIIFSSFNANVKHL